VNHWHLAVLLYILKHCKYSIILTENT
jgi:hypothetical protein